MRGLSKIFYLTLYLWVSKQWMCVKGEYVNGYEIYANLTLLLTFRTRFCTTTAISDAANIRGEYCVLAKEKSVKDDQIIYGVMSEIMNSNFNSTYYGLVISEVSTFIMTAGV